MPGLKTAVVMFLIAFFAWIVLRNVSRSKQSELPFLLICEGIGLLSGGILSCLDFNLHLGIKTKDTMVFGFVKNPDTDYVLVGCGMTLIILGVILWCSIRKRIYILNMLGKVKHEISDVKTVNALRLKDYQLKETMLDLRWAINDINQQKWEIARAQIEEYIGEFSARSDASTVCFTGMAPIPFEVYAGTCMTGHAIERFFEYKRSEDAYYELKHKRIINPVAWPKSETIPALTESALTGDGSTEVVIAVSITETVQDSDMMQFKSPKIRLGIDNPMDNAITSIPQLRDYVSKTNEMIIQLKSTYPNLTRVHIISAVPSCYAIELGCKLGHLDNRSPEIVVYHYVATATPKYKYGIVVTGENKGNLVINNELVAG